MTWGPMFIYYHCEKCGKKFKYEIGLMDRFGENFGMCPICKTEGVFEEDGPRQLNDYLYEEVDC